MVFTRSTLFRETPSFRAKRTWNLTMLKDCAQLYLCATLVFARGGILSNAYIFPPIISSVTVNGELGVEFLLRAYLELNLSCTTASQELDYNISWRFYNSWSSSKVSGQLPVEWRLVQQAGKTDMYLNSSAIKQDPAKFEGWYECVVNSSAGMTISSPVKIVFPNATANRFQSDITPVAVTALVGSTVILPCNSSEPLTYYPLLSIAKPMVSWGSNRYYSRVIYEINRVATDDIGTLYIRDARLSDSFISDILECTGSSRFEGKSKVIGQYTLHIKEAESRPSGPRLVYRTPDLTTTKGSLVFMSCMFEDSTKPNENVTWNGPRLNVPYHEDTEQSLLVLTNVDSNHNGLWQCSYKGVSGFIFLTVLEYPVLTHSGDVYVHAGEDAQFSCSLSSFGQATFWWLFNGKKINPSRRFLITSGANGTRLTMLNAGPLDKGVFQCAANNNVATALQTMRLIYIDKPKVTLSTLLPEADVYAERSTVYINGNTTAVRFTCNYSISDEIASTRTVWQLQNFNGDVTSSTSSPKFGIKDSIYEDIEQHLSVITVFITEESFNNVLGDVKCVLLYTVLDKEFRVASEEVGKILQQFELQVNKIPDAWFPYWIVGVILFAVTVVVLMIILVSRAHHKRQVARKAERAELETRRDPNTELQVEHNIQDHEVTSQGQGEP